MFHAREVMVLLVGGLVESDVMDGEVGVDRSMI